VGSVFPICIVERKDKGGNLEETSFVLRCAVAL